VVHRCECNLHSNLLTKILEHCTVKILCAVDRNLSGNTIVIDDILLEELFDCCGAYICERLCLDPLREVFDCNNDEGVIALRWG
jgi:hypothetical protein